MNVKYRMLMVAVGDLLWTASVRCHACMCMSACMFMCGFVLMVAVGNMLWTASVRFATVLMLVCVFMRVYVFGVTCLGETHTHT